MHLACFVPLVIMAGMSLFCWDVCGVWFLLPESLLLISVRNVLRDYIDFVDRREGSKRNFAGLWRELADMWCLRKILTGEAI